MTASAWDKFLLLLWKNWLIQIRHPVQTIFEVLVPVLVCALVVLIRGYVNTNEFKKDTRYSAIENDFIQTEILLAERENLVLAYSPNNLVLNGLMQNVVNNLNFTELIACLNSTELEKYAVRKKPFASIEFEDSLKVDCEIVFNSLQV
jgi:ATP-binding cassette, subfamily A (ABC1), member 3